MHNAAFTFHTGPKRRNLQRENLQLTEPNILSTDRKVTE